MLFDEDFHSLNVMLFLNEYFIRIISAWLVAKQALKFK